MTAADNAIRAVVDALENEHRHVENLVLVYPREDADIIMDSRKRMGNFAGMLERLANPPLYIKSQEPQ